MPPTVFEMSCPTRANTNDARYESSPRTFAAAKIRQHDSVSPTVHHQFAVASSDHCLRNDQEELTAKGEARHGRVDAQLPHRYESTADGRPAIRRRSDETIRHQRPVENDQPRSLYEGHCLSGRVRRRNDERIHMPRYAALIYGAPGAPEHASPDE